MRAAVLLQVGAIHTPFGQLVFDTEHLALLDWGLIVLVCSTIWLVDELRKKMRVFN